MNKPKSFTAWVVVTPHDVPMIDTARPKNYLATHCYENDYNESWSDAVERGWTVRKIRYTFVTPAKPTEGRT